MDSLDPKDGFVGSQGIWNFFDLFLCLVAYLDLVLQAATTHPPESTGANLLRFFRLIRSLENDWPSGMGRARFGKGMVMFYDLFSEVILNHVVNVHTHFVRNE